MFSCIFFASIVEFYCDFAEQLLLAKTSVQDDPTHVKWDINHLNPTFVDGINHFFQAHLYRIFYIMVFTGYYIEALINTSIKI